MDRLYMDIAHRLAQESYAVRKKVGFVLVKDDNIISSGWNGTPTGDNNCCEEEHEDGTLTTKSSVLHAELNSLMKLVAVGGPGTEGATGYTTLSPCTECGKLIKQARLKRIVYAEEYRDRSGIDFLRKRGIVVDKIT